MWGAWLFVGLCGPAQIAHAAGDAVSPHRIVSVGASVTEIVFALGEGPHVVGTDTSSQYPKAAQRLPQVGYHRALSAEGVLALRPTVLITTDEAGPPAALAQLRAAGVNIHTVSTLATPAGAENKIRSIAEALGAQTRGAALVATLRAELRGAAETDIGAAPKVVFVYARGSGALLVAGRDTAASGVVELAGGKNAVTGYTGYKPLTAEAMVAAQPDIIVLPQRALAIVGGTDALLRAPGVMLTPAGKNRRIVGVDDVLVLGFGPRLGVAVATLKSAFRDPAESAQK